MRVLQLELSMLRLPVSQAAEIEHTTLQMAMSVKQVLVGCWQHLERVVYVDV
jgi:hypothetical protein